MYAADGPIADIKAEKLTLFGALADISGATGPLSSEKARVTILAPTDEVRMVLRSQHPCAELAMLLLLLR